VLFTCVRSSHDETDMRNGSPFRECRIPNCGCELGGDGGYEQTESPRTDKRRRRTSHEGQREVLWVEHHSEDFDVMTSSSTVCTQIG